MRADARLAIRMHGQGLEIEASSDHPVLSMGLAERGDADGVSSTVGVVRCVGPSDEVDAAHTTHRSPQPRRQGVACTAPGGRGRSSGDVSAMWAAKPADGTWPGPAWPR